MENKKKILIVGVNSILGRSIIELLNETYLITGVYNENTNNLNSTIKNISLKEIHSLNDEYESVFFLSAYIPGKNEVNHQQLFDINVQLLVKCLNLFKSARFILASSVSIYGQINQEINENSPSLNVTPYGLSKLWAEQVLQNHHSYAIMRISSMYGEKMKTDTFLPIIIKDAIVKEEITLYGNGDRLQNYIYISDVARCFVLASLSKINSIFLAVGNNSYSNLDVAKIIQSYLPNTKIKFRLKDTAFSSVFNSDYTCEHLNWNNKVEMQQGIKKVIEWIKKEY